MITRKLSYFLIYNFQFGILASSTKNIFNLILYSFPQFLHLDLISNDFITHQLNKDCNFDFQFCPMSDIDSLELVSQFYFLGGSNRF